MPKRKEGAKIDAAAESIVPWRSLRGIGNQKLKADILRGASPSRKALWLDERGRVGFAWLPFRLWLTGSRHYPTYNKSFL